MSSAGRAKTKTVSRQWIDSVISDMQRFEVVDLLRGGNSKFQPIKIVMAPECSALLRF